MKIEPKVTISLLTWNGEKYLPWLLNSLENQTFKNWELLVLDNASQDNSVSVVSEHMPKAKIIRQKKNVGFARGHNLLINWSDSDYVLILNQDVILEPEYLRTCVDFMEANKRAGSVSGKLLQWDFIEAKKTNIIDSLGLKINRQRKVIDIDQGKADCKIANQEVFGLSATAALYRRSALESIKMSEYFDEDFFSYKEDVDLAWRLRLFGWQNWLVADAIGYHHRTMSAMGHIRERRKNKAMANKLSYRNHLLTIYKNDFSKNKIKDCLPIAWYEFRKFCYLLFFETKTLKGLFAYFKLLPKMRQKQKYIQKFTKITAEDIYQWISQ